MRPGTSGQLCVRQVKMPDGSWTDVDTSPDEAAVFLGAATEQATAGLLKAATYRVVSATLLHTCCIEELGSNVQHAWSSLARY